MASDGDRDFMTLAVTEARKSLHKDARPHPNVGVVITRNGDMIGCAAHGERHDGEDPHCDHAEFIALQKKLPNDTLQGCTVYTTLEPCTKRNLPKLPCVDRLIDRHVDRVVIGMLDPNQIITGKGLMKLRKANIAVDLFPPDLMAQLEELNRDFMREHGVSDSAPVPCHGTKYDVPDRERFWNDLLESAQDEFILVGNSNKSWLRRDENQSRTLGEAIARIVNRGGRVVIISGKQKKTVTRTNAFIAKYVVKHLSADSRADLEGDAPRFIYAQAARVNYSAVLSDDRLLIMPRLNSPEFTAEAMVLELRRSLHATQFRHYKDDINRVIWHSAASRD